MESSEISKSKDVAALNEALARLQGSTVAWWSYTSSLNTLVLLIGDADGEQNLVIALSASQHICGPVAWQARELQVKFERTPDSWEFTVSDSPAGFSAKSRMLAWRKNFDLKSGRSLVFPT
jgi:hypothetical protein